MTPIETLLVSVPLFTGVSEPELKELSKIVKEKIFPKGSVVFFENEPGQTFYIIESGFIKISLLSEGGKAKTLSILKKNDYFGEMAVLNGKYRSATAEALVDSRVLLIYRKEFTEFIKKSPHLALNIIHTLSDRLREANRQIENLVFKDSQGKLVSTLLKLVEQFGEKKESTTVVNLSLTHQEISEMAGISRETVTRLISKLEKDGILKYGKRKLQILQEEKLKNIG